MNVQRLSLGQLRQQEYGSIANGVGENPLNGNGGHLSRLG